MILVDSARTALSHTLQRFERQPQWVLITVGMLLNTLIGILDHITGYEIAFSIFYLLPVAIVARWGGMKAGVAMSVVGAATWLVADVASGHPYSHPLIAYWNALVRLGFLLVVTLSLDTIRRSTEYLKRVAKTDPLTGVLNARGFVEHVQNEIERAHRYGHPLALAYLDLDDFKAVNDNWGHSAGDELLAATAKVMNRNIRKTDLLARLGGDEFAILFPETRSKWAQRVMNRIKEKLSEEMQAKGRPVTMSIGLVVFVTAPRSADEMIRTADDLMYRAKRSGKNALMFATYRDGESAT